MHLVGYAWLHEAMQLSAFPLRLPAVVQPVTRLEKIGQTLAVPPATAPAPDDLLGHVLFALKHEGINLTILAQALPQIPVTALELALQRSSQRHLHPKSLLPTGSLCRRGSSSTCAGSRWFRRAFRS
jgi:hypothetical protein